MYHFFYFQYHISVWIISTLFSRLIGFLPRIWLACVRLTSSRLFDYVWRSSRQGAEPKFILQGVTKLKRWTYPQITGVSSLILSVWTLPYVYTSLTARFSISFTNNKDTGQDTETNEKEENQADIDVSELITLEVSCTVWNTSKLTLSVFYQTGI